MNALKAMPGIWTGLTSRHKQYSFFALWAGLAIGAVAGLIFALIFGFGFTVFGFIVISSKWDKKDQAYNTWMAIAFGAIAVGLMAFVGAVFGLYAHQQGWV